MVHVRCLGPQIGAEIHGVDVRKLDDASFAEIYRAWLGHNVVVVPGQDLEIEDFLTYSRRFGFVTPHPSKMTRHPDHPEITLLGANKFGADGTLDMAIYRRGAEGWHTDGAYDQERSRPRSSTRWPCRAGAATRCSPACTRPTTRCRRGSRSVSRGGSAPSPTVGAARRLRCSTRRTATGSRSSIRSSARIPRPDARGSTSIRARFSGSRGSSRRRATR